MSEPNGLSRKQCFSRMWYCKLWFGLLIIPFLVLLVWGAANYEEWIGRLFLALSVLVAVIMSKIHQYHYRLSSRISMYMINRNGSLDTGGEP